MGKDSPVAKALLVLVILASLNLLGTRFFHRWDLTEDHEFTLNPATDRVLGRLDDVVNIKAYFSRELPSYFATLDRQVKDLLDEYVAHGGDKVKVQFLDPASDPAVAQAVQMMGIPKLQFSQFKSERAEVVNGYMGIAVEYEDKNEVIPVVQSVDRLEYDLTAAIVKVMSEPKTVGIATAGDSSVPDDLKQLEKLLRRQYVTRVVNLETGPVPDKVTTLVVRDMPGLSDQALYRIDQFLMRGGRLLVFTGSVDVNLSTLQAWDRPSKLAPLLRSYGVELEKGMVVDAQAPMVSFDVGFFLPLSVRYPWFPQVMGDGLSRSNPVTSDMKTLVLPWVSPLKPVPVDTAVGGSVQVEELARSSRHSYVRRAPYDLSPRSRLAAPPAGSQPVLLAAALTGRFPSRWQDDVPVPGDSLGTADRGPKVSSETQIVVVGSPYFVQDRFLGQFPSNGVFLANAVDWMTLGQDLISIRSRGAVDRPLREVDEHKRSWLKMLAMIPVPILVVLFGLVRARVRRARRRRYAETLGGGVA